MRGHSTLRPSPFALPLAGLALDLVHSPRLLLASIAEELLVSCTDGTNHQTRGRHALSRHPTGDAASGGEDLARPHSRTADRVRVEQSGFRPEEEANYQGASYGWQR